MKMIKNFFTFKGNYSRFEFLCLICAIELLRVLIIGIYACFSLPHKPLIVFCADFPLMLGILYFYGASIAGRLNKLNIDPRFAYFGVLNVWLCKYALLPLAHTSGNMQFVYASGALFVLLLAPLFAQNKKALLLSAK